MPHTRGSKSIGTLMVEKAIDGIEPTRAEIFILTHQRRKDGRPLDDVSAKIVVFGTNIGQEKAPEMPHMSFGAHESQLPTKSTATMKTGLTHVFLFYTFYFFLNKFKLLL
ncbi:uncharacterized protein LOC109793330 isoform X1 [Cajanus cajan]|uniref:uncharacterized protein LOC109793330 isoform X1 n=1 Tax=Cajanus cajan TaxID=3821 RepID=UPI00098DC649|nr:uncharacterized protein LOC109793330 isoform X1 [Cajanus cajan]